MFNRIQIRWVWRLICSSNTMVIKPSINFPCCMDWGIVLHENKTRLPEPRNLILQNKLIRASWVPPSLRFLVTFYYDEIWSSSSPNCTPNHYTNIFALSLWKNKLFLPLLVWRSKDPLSSTFSPLNRRFVAEDICLPLLPRPILARETPFKTNFCYFLIKKWSLFYNPLLNTLFS